MKQKMQYIQTLKQTLKLNQKLLKSLDFLTDNIDDINKVIQDILETNPFLELKSSKNYDNQQFIPDFWISIVREYPLFLQFFGQAPVPYYRFP